MVVAFTYFYTMVVFQQQRIAENLQRQGAFIPGIRPGANTNRYLTGVLTRITLVGAVFLGVVAILPYIASQITGVQTLLLSSTSMIIVVAF
jgi:preprotein translocase subunit SecY